MTGYVLQGIFLTVMMTGCATSAEPPRRASGPITLVAQVCTAEAACLATGQRFDGAGASIGLATLAAVRDCRAACAPSSGCPIVARGCE